MNRGIIRVNIEVKAPHSISRHGSVNTLIASERPGRLEEETCNNQLNLSSGSPKGQGIFISLTMLRRN